MENQRQNPLAKHFRQPAIYLKLPSNGRWWAAGSLDMPANSEFPIYPMSTKDEILLRTPDALLNGQGLVDVIQSCVPNIKNAWAMPSVDLDAILIAIRIATYGNNMKFDSKCPHCEENNTHEVELGSQLGSINCPHYENTLQHKDLTIKFKPQQYLTVNRTNMLEYEEQRILNILAETEMEPESKATQLTDAMDKLYRLGIESSTNSTESITMTDGTVVDDPEFISEFYRNSDSSVIKKVQSKLREYVMQAKPQSLNLQCQACTKAYQADLTFDYSNFFDKGF